MDHVANEDKSPVKQEAPKQEAKPAVKPVTGTNAVGTGKGVLEIRNRLIQRYLHHLTIYKIIRVEQRFSHMMRKTELHYRERYG